MGNLDGWENGYPVNAKSQCVGDTARFAPEAHDPDVLNKLLDFCVNNTDLVKLENIISSFNPLKILGVADFEIRHSNVLSWLIDPNGHHGLGDTLFKNFLLEALKHNRNSDLPQIKDVISASFADLRVMREYKNIDVLAASISNRIVVVIENKIHADESENQLAKYAAIVDKKYRDFKKVFVLLTLDGSAPKGSSRYLTFTHEQIYGIVWSAVEVRKDYMHTKVYDFICQYLEVLKEKTTMQSSEFMEICGRLYKEHGEAIRMILEYGKPKLPTASMRDFHSRTETVSIHEGKDNVPVYYSLIPKNWNGIVPTTNRDSSDRYLVFAYINLADYEKHKIALSIRVGSFPDAEERQRFLRALGEAAEADPKSNLNVKLASKSYTTVFTQSLSLRQGGNGEIELDDYDTIIDKLVEAYNSEEMKRALTIVDGVVQKFEFKDIGK